ncbi:hypothetical protein D3C79_817170 [compost metagenome]
MVRHGFVVARLPRNHGHLVVDVLFGVEHRRAVRLAVSRDNQRVHVRHLLVQVQRDAQDHCALELVLQPLGAVLCPGVDIDAVGPFERLAGGAHHHFNAAHIALADARYFAPHLFGATPQIGAARDPGIVHARSGVGRRLQALDVVRGSANLSGGFEARHAHDGVKRLAAGCHAFAPGP